MTRLVIPALVLLLGGSGILSEPAFTQTTGTPVLTVTAAKPEERQWPETIPAGGWLKPWHEAVIAAEIDGLRITEVLADVGSVVAKGQALARLADDSVNAELRKAEAALATTRADLTKAKANADRARQVQGSGALSGEKITEYLAAEQTAIAGVESAEASLQSQKIKLVQTTITAADDGLITSRSAQLGAVVSTGTELFRLIRQGRIEWQAEVSARYFPRLETGLTATINGPGDRRTKGVVRLVGPTINIDTGRAIAYVALPAEAHPPVGLYVTGQIELGMTAALTVPEVALVLRDGLSYVFAVGEDRRVSRVRVETGRRNGGRVEITSGLDSAALVVTTGGAFLSDKALVRLAGEDR